MGAKDNDGNTAADLAEERGHQDLADMLRRRAMLRRLQTSSRGRQGATATPVAEGERCRGPALHQLSSGMV